MPRKLGEKMKEWNKALSDARKELASDYPKVEWSRTFPKKDGKAKKGMSKDEKEKLKMQNMLYLKASAKYNLVKCKYDDKK